LPDALALRLERLPAPGAALKKQRHPVTHLRQSLRLWGVVERGSNHV
jgi:hypothetical protein